MKNIDIKKILEQAIKLHKVANPIVKLILWHGDTTERNNAVYNEVVLYDDNELINMEDTIYLLEMEDNADNVILLKQEQNKLYKYLTKHFKNIEIKEYSV